ncbi:hypothetical protein [Roseinatronobacter sp. NSM]|uniref:hypothetical protein n=1 Tax=Roseinatronobacter sp. NSM TaxID=3457785 RepID=UPI004036E4C5
MKQSPLDALSFAGAATRFAGVDLPFRVRDLVSREAILSLAENAGLPIETDAYTFALLETWGKHIALASRRKIILFNGLSFVRLFGLKPNN